MFCDGSTVFYKTDGRKNIDFSVWGGLPAVEDVSVTDLCISSIINFLNLLLSAVYVCMFLIRFYFYLVFMFEKGGVGGVKGKTEPWLSSVKALRDRERKNIFFAENVAVINHVCWNKSVILFTLNCYALCLSVDTNQICK